ncbi:MAG: hypothetical protein IJU70_08225, partial [Lentisphaeria bacterium]|nr:hypothetical protein [Lentisphaeria bacterium]
MKRSFVLLFAFALTGALAAAVIEAESGTLAPNGAKIAEYADASGGRIVRLLGAPALKRDAVKPETPDLVVPFTVAQDDAYGITAYVCTEHTGNDSVYFRVDDGKMLEKHFGYPKKSVPIEFGTFELNAGAHKLAFYHRESNFGIDKIEVKPVKRVPRMFTVKGQTGTVQTYTVRAPAPGNYILRVFCHREKAGPQQNARVTIGDNMPIIRRIIFPTITKGTYEIERIPFRGKPVALKLEIAPEVIIDQLVFQPVRKRLPREAEVYVPKIVPRPDRPRLLVNNDLLPIVKDRLKRGQNALAWEEVRKIALRPYKFVVPKDREVMWDERLIQAMRAKALYYLITGDEKVGREACELAVAYFKVVNFGNGQDICRRTGAAIQSASFVYDWCYPVMTDAERAILRDRFLWQAESMEIGWPPFNQ